MKLSQQELVHIGFLCQVILEGGSRKLKEDALQCLLYIVKSLPDADVLEAPAEQIRELVKHMEEELREDQSRLREIQANLRRFDQDPSQRKPFG